MASEPRLTRRLGVFASLRGWLVAGAGRVETFDNRADAVAKARQLAHVFRWRGVRAEVLAQDGAGEALRVIDPPPSEPA